MSSDMTRTGRDALMATVDRLLKTNEKLIEERDAYLANLTAVQARCTELEQAFRSSKFVEHLEGAETSLLTRDAIRSLMALSVLNEAIWRARERHPEGCDLRALVEEVGEVADAMRRAPDRVRAELIDVATVAMRLFMGECVP